MDAGPGGESPVPAEHSSSWSFNWVNLIPLLLIAAIAVVGWRWLDGTAILSQGDDPSGAPDVSTTSSPVDTVERAAPVVVPSTTTTPPTRPTDPPTTTIASEASVLISGEMKPCRFGAECLVASFRIEGFAEHPGRFVCIYPNSRSDFTFGADGVDDACLTADEGDTITIEVDGVRSATISEQDLDGAG